MKTYTTIEAAIEAAMAEISTRPFDVTTFVTDSMEPVRETDGGFVYGHDSGGTLLGYVSAHRYRTVEEVSGE